MLSKVYNQNTLGIIVAYNPEMELLIKNAKAAIAQVDEILIINNSNYDINLDSYSIGNVNIINNNRNLGISKALNIGIDYAKEHNYDYVLLLDQDSTLTDNFIKNMLDGFKQEDVCMICPNVVYIDGKNNKINENMKFEKIELGITSGSLLNMNVLNKIKFDNNIIFNEDFFIDYVDFDFSLTIRNKGYLILRCNESKLYHRLGNVKTYRFANLEVHPTNHNYIRRYYITRNRMYMWKKYIISNSKFVIKDIIRSIYEIILIILFEDNKLKKLKSVIRGVEDFLCGKVGGI